MLYINIHQILTLTLYVIACVWWLEAVLQEEVGGAEALLQRVLQHQQQHQHGQPQSGHIIRIMNKYSTLYLIHTAGVLGTFCFWIHLWEQSCGPVLDTWHRNIWCWQWSAETPSSCTCTQEGVGSVSSTKVEPLPTFFYSSSRTFNLHSKLDEHPENVTKCFWSGLKY